MVGTALSAAALYLAFRNVPLGGLWSYLALIDYRFTLPALALVLSSYIVRALRWRYLLAPGHRVTVAGAFGPMMIGFMINCIMPGRVGEIARPLALKQTRKVAFGTGLATVFVERFFDLFIAAALFLAVINIVRIDPQATISFGSYRLDGPLLKSLFAKTMIASLVLLGGLASICNARMRGVLASIALWPSRLIGRFAPRLSLKTERYFSRPVAEFLETVAGGLRSVGSPRKILICLALSALVWGVQLLSFAVLSWGFPGVDLTVLEMGAVMVIILFFIALPSVPGWWGLWEAGGVFAMGLFGVPKMEAAGFTLVNHALQVLPVIAVGLVCAMISSVSIWRVARAEAGPKRGARPALDAKAGQ